MSKIDKLLKSINTFIKKAEEDEEQLQDIVPEFPGLEKLPAIIEDFETTIARLLREQRKRFLDAIKAFIVKDEKDTLEALLVYLKDDLFAADDFADQFGDEAADFMNMTIEELTKAMMESIDKDVPFEVLSKRTTDWVKGWSRDLAELMELNTHEALEKELLQAIDQGESIADFELRVKDMPQFDRTKARATARTEILTASSQAHYESFSQSPAVVGKRWKHSGSKNNNPRETHMAMDGFVVGVDEYFYVDGEAGLYPRDVNFSAKNRINCGCTIGPDVDETIIRLSREEKEKIRLDTLKELNL